MQLFPRIFISEYRWFFFSPSTAMIFHEYRRRDTARGTNPISSSGKSNRERENVSAWQ